MSAIVLNDARIQLLGTFSKSIESKWPIRSVDANLLSWAQHPTRKEIIAISNDPCFGEEEARGIPQ
jgi:hypothetical protein